MRIMAGVCLTLALYAGWGGGGVKCRREWNICQTRTLPLSNTTVLCMSGDGGKRAADILKNMDSNSTDDISSASNYFNDSLFHRS